VVVLGSAWAVPLTGLVLARLGADVVRVVNPHREDPFALRHALLDAQSKLALDLSEPDAGARLAHQLTRADLLIEGTPPRVLANAGLADRVLLEIAPRLAVLRMAAFARDDRPGYGLAAECSGGWAARTDPPRLGRSSVADPVAGLLGAMYAVDLLARDRRGARVRISLEDAIGFLFAYEGFGG